MSGPVSVSALVGDPACQASGEPTVGPNRRCSEDTDWEVALKNVLMSGILKRLLIYLYLNSF